MLRNERPAWLGELALELMAEPDLRPEDAMFVKAVVEFGPFDRARIWAARADAPPVVVSQYPSSAERPDGLVKAVRDRSEDPLTVDDAGRWVLLSLGEIGTLEVDAGQGTSDDFAALGLIAERFVQRVQASTLLESIVENLPDMVFVKDADELRFVHFNRAAEYLLGFAREDMLGRNDYDFFPREEADSFTAKDRAVLESAAVHDIPEEPIHTAAHGTRTLHTKKIPILGSDGKPRYLLGISRDITERKLIEERLMQSQKLEAIATLTSGLAHNFNNAAMVISGYAELALRTLGDDQSKMSGFLTKLRRASSRVSELADRLLGFARTRVLDRTPTDVGALIGETAHMLERVIPEVITVDIEGVKDRCFARVDRAQLEQVVVNLAVNARDAMKNGGRLSISVTKAGAASAAPDGAIVITVGDTGHGMDDVVRLRAFEPFFTTKPSGEGSGLGLYSAHEIIRQHDGQIEIDSAPDVGTTVTITLPAVAAPSRVTPAFLRPLDRLHVGDETILLVEDDADVRAVLAESLEANGYGVLVAENGVDALRLIDELDDEPIDLLLSDVVMPRMGGPELVRKLRDARPSLKVLLVSGYTSEAEKLQDDPDLIFVSKPVESDRLMAVVRTLLDS